jgi:hypothetical protein
MATNIHFNKSYGQEQNLIESLVVETIKIHGIDVKYLPKTIVNLDTIFQEDLISLFDRAYTIEAYPKDYSGFQGNGDMLSKFGLEIRDTINFCISKKRYREQIGNFQNNMRPIEGDIIYFPVEGSFFEIKYVNNRIPFFTLGANHVFELKCDKLEYNSERITVGIPEIDDKITYYSIANTGIDYITTDRDAVLQTEDGNNLQIETDKEVDMELNIQNKKIQDYSDTIINFNEENPFGNV